jgi:hypothetical protein
MWEFIVSLRWMPVPSGSRAAVEVNRGQGIYLSLVSQFKRSGTPRGQAPCTGTIKTNGNVDRLYVGNLGCIYLIQRRLFYSFEL